MNKHFVVLEFTPEHEGDVNGIPWVDLLAGGVKVTNWQYVTAPMSYEDALLKGLNDCISSHDFENDQEALDAVKKAVDEGKDIPDEILVWAPLDSIADATELLDHIDSFANGYIGRYTPINRPVGERHEHL